MVTAYVLAYYGVPSVLLERNLTTTKYVPVDIHDFA